MGFYKIGGNKARKGREESNRARTATKSSYFYIYISKNGRKGESCINSVFGLVKMALFNLTFESQTYLLN